MLSAYVCSMAERVGFEPTERFPVHSISSAANSTTLAPLRGRISNCEFRIANCEIQSTALVRLSFTNSKSAIRNPKYLWRRGWDSNPRWALTHSGFRDRCTNPLCDLSKNRGQKSEIRCQQGPKSKGCI